MKSIIFGADNSSHSSAVTNYNWITATFPSSWNSTESQRTAVVSEGFTLTNLYVEIDTQPGVGKSFTYKIRKNGADTALLVTIADTNISGTDSVNSATFSAGDTISISSNPSGTPATNTAQYWNMQQEGTNGAMIGGASTTASTSAANYSSLFGASSSGSQWSATEADKQTIIPTPGTLKNLYVKAETAPSGVTSYDYTIMVNGSPSAITTNMSGANTTANDITHTVSVSAGDTVSFLSSPNSTPTATRSGWSLSFSPTTDGESFFGFGSAAAISNTLTIYEQPLGLGNNGWNINENIRYMVLGPYTLTKLYVSIPTAAGSGVTRTLTLRKAGADTGLAVALPNTTSGNTTSTVTYSQGDKFTLQAAVTGGTAATSAGAHTGVLLYIAPTTSTNSGFFNFM